VTVPVPDKRYGPPKSEVYLWIVPANAAGTWRWQLEVGGAPVAYETELQQTFQMLAGTTRVGPRTARIEGGRVRGDEIRFMLLADVGGRELRQEFAGRIAGDTISGRMRPAGGGAEIEWKATRTRQGRIDTSGD